MSQTRTLLAGACLLLLAPFAYGSAATLSAQRPQDRRPYVLRKDTRAGAQALRPWCLQDRSQAETLTVAIDFTILIATLPRWYPESTTALIKRIHPDELRAGYRYPRFQIIRLDVGKTHIHGNLGLLWLDGEGTAELANIPDCAQAGDGFYGNLTRSIRVDPPKR